nr:immunoglobulin light chain junction region [Macaca mulatta]MOY14916.1 immunoglobulin light chain junction region [Macaca mulatta]MOY15447.1 immunoglobulin light chain junction region [Macaca mulatta]MOY15531.1 immunoglobulin light chain junction region [Macaca mulatta]MOY16223.1 immunoglobulin light chain junction region [Macaca mulatta]
DYYRQTWTTGIDVF